MSFDEQIKRLFPYIKYVCGGVSALMMIWLCLTLFTGGPFPFQTRGPLAKYDYYKLGDLEDWESVIDDPSSPDSDKLIAEVFMEGGEIKDITFGDPNDPNRVDPDLETIHGVSDDIQSATQQ